jgi:hypothetical protein
VGETLRKQDYSKGDDAKGHGLNEVSAAIRKKERVMDNCFLWEPEHAV